MYYTQLKGPQLLHQGQKNNSTCLQFHHVGVLEFSLFVF